MKNIKILIMTIMMGLILPSCTSINKFLERSEEEGNISVELDSYSTVFLNVEGMVSATGKDVPYSVLQEYNSDNVNCSLFAMTRDDMLRFTFLTYNFSNAAVDMYDYWEKAIEENDDVEMTNSETDLSINGIDFKFLEFRDDSSTMVLYYFNAGRYTCVFQFTFHNSLYEMKRPQIDDIVSSIKFVD